MKQYTRSIRGLQLAINAHKAIISEPNGYRRALNLLESQKQELREARDDIRARIYSRFNIVAKTLGDNFLFEASAPEFLKKFSPPKFRMQGSFSYHTCNRPAHVPPQEIDLDDGLFMPVSYFQTGVDQSPAVQSRAYFDIIEKILGPLCEEKGWKLNTTKASCVRVELDSTMHTDLALYAVPETEFSKLLEDAQKRGFDFSGSMKFEKTAYQMLHQDDIRLAHRHDDWIKSDPRKLEDWFLKAVRLHGDQVRTISRCLKGWKDYQWEKGRLASIALMSAVVSVFDKASSSIPKDRDDLALLRVTEDLPNILAHRIENPVVAGEYLDQGWTEEERADFVEKAQELHQDLQDGLRNSSNIQEAIDSLTNQFGSRIPNEPAMYVVDETAGLGASAPAVLTLGMLDKDHDSLPAVDKQGGGRYG